MVAILVFLTFMIAIFIEVMAHRKTQKKEVQIALVKSEKVTLSPLLAIPKRTNTVQFPNDFYYHNGHAWVKLEGRDKVRLGLDDLTQKVMGSIDEIELPPLGKELNQGDVAWGIRHGKRKLGQLSPLGGIVIEVNEKLKREPSLLNQFPYDEGWILKIKPKALGKEMSALMDSFHARIYLDEIKAKLRSSFNNENLGTVYGDGEEVITEASEKLDEKWWRIFVKQLFHSSPD